MCDAAITIIQEYIRKNLSDLSPSMTNHDFKKQSYQQWAAYELCNQIMDHPHESPAIVAENFMFTMAVYANYGKNEERSFIFKTAAETAEELISLLE